MNGLWITDPLLVARLKAIGEALDTGQQAFVFDEGFVRLSDEPESEVITDVAGQKAGPQSRSRPGQRARTWGAQAARDPFRSDALEAAYGTEFRILAQHYQALAFEERNGLWIVVPSKPLGPQGPEVHFVVALPINKQIPPRAWALERVGRSARFMSLKHTNFPDASVCAFPHGYVSWPNPEGILGLIDIFTLWAVRKLHRDLLGWWPGPQVGACSHYRLKEFDPREDCGCGSQKRYGSCHMARDVLEEPKAAKAEFRRLFNCDFDDRIPPNAILDFARSRWKRTPSMADLFSLRADPSGIRMH